MKEQERTFATETAATPAAEGAQGDLPASLSPGSLVPSAELPALAAGFVHEVRNPLAAIHLHLQLLEKHIDEVSEKDLRKKIQGKVSFIKGEISRLDRTLHGLISLIRPRQLPPSERFDLNEVIQQVIQLLAPQAREVNATIEFKPARIAKICHLDPVMIRQVVLNLILNSLQAFERVAISFKDRKVEVITGERKNLIFIEISDNGPGISPEQQQHIFEPFYSTRKGEGSGLGLALVKKMIVSMKGHLEMSSEVNRGATFIALFRKET